MKLTINLYATDYGTIIASTVNMSGCGYTNFHQVEIEFDDKLIPTSKEVEKNYLLKDLENVTSKFDESRTKIISKLNKLGFDGELPHESY